MDELYTYRHICDPPKATRFMGSVCDFLHHNPGGSLIKGGGVSKHTHTHALARSHTLLHAFVHVVLITQKGSQGPSVIYNMEADLHLSSGVLHSGWSWPENCHTLLKPIYHVKARSQL